MPFLVHSIMHTAWVCKCFWFRLKMSWQLRAVRCDQHGLLLFFNPVCSKWISCAENMKPAPFFSPFFVFQFSYSEILYQLAVLYFFYLFFGGGGGGSFSSHCGLMYLWHFRIVSKLCMVRVLNGRDNGVKQIVLYSSQQHHVILGQINQIKCLCLFVCDGEKVDRTGKQSTVPGVQWYIWFNYHSRKVQFRSQNLDMYSNDITLKNVYNRSTSFLLTREKWCPK